MSVIRINSIYEETRTSKAGKKYGVTVVTGTKYGTDDDWEQPIFSNNKKMLRQLEEFGKGDVANFRYEKNDRGYNDLVAVETPNKELIAKIDSGEVTTFSKGGGGGKSSSNVSNGGGSDKMSKAEWAEKDRLTNIRISKAVALKVAADNAKTGTIPTALITFAEELMPWLLDTGNDGAVTVDPEDALSPPVE
jgi:hypothetical protein